MFSSLYSPQVTDENDQPLPAVLLSLSASQFRSNNFSLENGTMVFANLVGLSLCILLKLPRFNGSFNFRTDVLIFFCVSCVVFLGSWPVLFPTDAERVYLLACFTGLFTFLPVYNIHKNNIFCKRSAKEFLFEW